MSMMVSFCVFLYPRDVLDEILNLIESVSEGFPSYSCLLGVVIVLCNSPVTMIFLQRKYPISHGNDITGS